MKHIYTCLLTMAALIPPCADAAPVSLSKSVQIEAITTVSTEELWNTAKPKSVMSGEVAIRQLGIDSEAGDIQGKFQACALILIGTGDLGIRPVALRLWTSVPCDGSVSAMPPSNTPGEAKFKLRATESQSFTIHVTDNEKVRISGIAVGSIGY